MYIGLSCGLRFYGGRAEQHGKMDAPILMESVVITNSGAGEIFVIPV